MSCPTCDHTMESLPASSQADETTTFLCPRCGTVKIEQSDGPEIIYVPTLVERCRVFEQEVKDESPIADVTFGVIISVLRRLGIAESINKPEDRK